LRQSQTIWNDKAGRAVLLEDGRASVELVTAIYDAARSGRSVTLPLTADHPLWRGWVPEGRT
jgi:hypothetical protein